MPRPGWHWIPASPFAATTAISFLSGNPACCKRERFYEGMRLAGVPEGWCASDGKHCVPRAA